MKILQVCPGYYPSIGGVEEHVRNISERLAKQHEVTVFTCDPTRTLPREEEINGVLVRRFRSFSPGNAYHISFEMARELRKSEFDIVHGHNYHAFPLYLSRYTKRKKFVVTPHYMGCGFSPVRNLLIKLYRPLGKKIFEDAGSIIATSNYEGGLLLEDFDIDKGRISFVPNGISLAEFSSLEGIQRETKTILCVSRLEEHKGIQYMIQTLPLLDDDFRLEIVGRGAYKGKLMDLVSRLQLNSRVGFYEGLPRTELLRMFARAGVFVLLSRHENFGIVVAEALAARVPCIVANTSALREWVDNENCFGIEYPIHSKELAELIEKVHGREVKNAKLWDWGDVVWQLENIYSLSSPLF